MKIDITKYKGDPYVAVCETIREMTRDKYGYEDMPDRLVRIKTSVLGEDNVLLTSDSDNCYWDTDWYEGGDVELLGFINIDDIPVPTLEQLKWKYPRIKGIMKEQEAKAKERK